MTVRTDADAPARIEIIARGKHAVAEIRLGRETQARDRAARRETRAFVRVDMRRVHEAPALVDIEAFEQPFHRTMPGRRDARFHFGDLLRDVDMHRRMTETPFEPLEPFEQRRERFARDRAQRMRRDAVTPRAVLGRAAASVSMSASSVSGVFRKRR